jgi:hypothetical protein
VPPQGLDVSRIFTRDVICVMHVGTPPVKKFVDSSMELTLLSAPQHDGKLPMSWLSRRYSSCRAVAAHRLVGMVPVKLLPFTYSCLCPRGSRANKTAVTLMWAKYAYTIRHYLSLAKPSGGRYPEKLFSSSNSCSMFVMVVICDGMVPVMLLYRSSKLRKFTSLDSAEGIVPTSFTLVLMRRKL